MTCKIAFASGLLGLTALACDARTPIGALADGSAGTTGSAGAAATIDASADASQPDFGTANNGTCTPVKIQNDSPFSSPFELMGVWTGQVQGSSPPVSSDAITLTINENEIRVVFGTDLPPPAVTTANELYPPQWKELLTARMPPLPLFEGLAYVAHAVRWAATGPGYRVTFGILTYQGWESWCRLQTSYPVNIPGYEGSYRCLAYGVTKEIKNAGQDDEMCFYVGPDGQEMPTSCTQFLLCGDDICTCDACGCGLSSYLGWTFDITFPEVNFQFDHATGANISLTRVPRTN